MELTGKVTLVGAGPGDGGLMTLKGRQAIGEADVVVYDRLVDPEILDMIPEGARRIDVGKNAGNHPVPQDQINEILIREAGTSAHVVRLKGGDSFVFGRGGEELEALARQNIPFEVVPGITSAFAAAAYAGIPVTHRDYCDSVHIITGHRRRGVSLALDYDLLSRLNGTLIFLMALASFGEIARGLMAAGMDGEFPCAVVENGTRPEQRKWLTTLSGAEDCIRLNGVRSPAIFIVGRVCELSDKMDWFGRLPLKGVRVLVPRPRKDSHRMADLLRAQGARVRELPAAEPVFLDFQMPPEGVSLIFPDAEAVGALMEKFRREGKDARALAGRRLICLGKDARSALERYGLRADDTRRLEDVRENRAALLCEEGEAPSGCEEITPVPVWRKAYPAPPAEIYDADYVVFTTMRGVEAFRHAMAGRNAANLSAICIGPMTQKAAESLGMKAVQSEAHTMASVAERLAQTVRAYAAERGVQP